MNRLRHECSQRGMHYAMALHGFLAAELCRDNVQAIVAAAIAGASVAGMESAVVDDIDGTGFQRSEQAAHLVWRAYGSTFLNGLTVAGLA